MNKIIILFSSVVIILSIWSYDFFSFLEKIPKVENNSYISSDAIIVLTGGSGRITKGLFLLEKGVSDKLFISGVNPNFDIKDIKTELDPNKKIILGREALNTSGNAIEVSKWIKEEKITNIGLVTSSYHMPRSLLEINYTLPQLEVISHPVLPKRNKSDFGSKQLGFIILAEEYFKFLIARIKYFKLVFSK
tara:strand:- start:65 stop:637 length:573 start_codon:yes stop_codon:yes gene_type:complete